MRDIFDEDIIKMALGAGALMSLEGLNRDQWLSKARTLRQQGQNKKSIEAYRKVLQLDPVLLPFGPAGKGAKPNWFISTSESRQRQSSLLITQLTSTPRIAEHTPTRQKHT